MSRNRSGSIWLCSFHSFCFEFSSDRYFDDVRAACLGDMLQGNTSVEVVNLGGVCCLGTVGLVPLCFSFWCWCPEYEFIVFICLLCQPLVAPVGNTPVYFLRVCFQIPNKIKWGNFCVAITFTASSSVIVRWAVGVVDVERGV